MRIRALAACCFAGMALGEPLAAEQGAVREPLTIASPSGELVVAVTLPDGAPHYAVSYAGRELIRPSRLGFRLADAPPLEAGF
jgi:alpha-glucosidase